VDEQCRLSVNTSGCFYHPFGDQTTIDCRYGELLATFDLPNKQILYVTERHVIDWGKIKRPRGIEIHNASNLGTQSQPTDEERERMQGRILFVGFNDDTQPAITLPPYVPGVNQFGGSQFLWLADGVRCWLDVPAGAKTSAKVIVYPGASDG
jgi:hypothetical protein